MEQKYSYNGEKMGTNFPGNSMDFAAFFHAIGNWWGNPCISHIIKHTIGCESNGKNHPYYGKSTNTNFPGSPHTLGFVAFSWEPISHALPHLMGFPAFSHALGNWWENPCFSHMMKYTTGWKCNGKNHSFYRKSMGTNSSGLPHSMGFAEFSNALGNLWRKPMHFPRDEVYQREGI